MGNKKVLIVCYTFPPEDGVGGRRWAKFSKYLVREGHDVKVICAQPKSKKISNWSKDIEELGSKNITSIKSNYPRILGETPRTILDKINYRLSLLYVKLMVKGNYYDKSTLLDSSYLKEIEKLIGKGYNNVVVSIGPFLWSEYVIKLKAKFKDVNYILDVRDPWTVNETGFGFDEIGEKRLGFEKQSEKAVIQGFDKIVSVSQEINEHFRTLDNSEKYYVIPNGFDVDDYSEEEGNTPDNNIGEKVKFVFAGTFYKKALHHLEALSVALENMDSQWRDRVEFHFYGNMIKPGLPFFKEGIPLHFHGRVPFEEVKKIVSNSHLAMLFMSDDLNYSFSTKFYEYLAHKKPICVFSKPGGTSNFVEENKIGYGVYRETITEQIIQIVKDFDSNNLGFSQEFDSMKYSVGNLTKEYTRLLK